MLAYRTVARRLLSIVILLAVPLLFWPATMTLGMPLPQQLGPAPDFAAIDAFVAAEMEATRLPGVALAIVQGDRIVHLRGFGNADSSGRAVTPQTPFTIGSTTKSFTALATMQLIEAGKVALDAPVQRYLPWFTVADEGAAARITVRHLLNQTSGFPTRETAAQLARKDSSAGALERYVRALRSVHLTAPVGSTFQYSNTNWNVLGLIVQTIAAQPYEHYVQQHIFAPLAMRNSFTSPGEARAHGRAMGHRYWFGRPVPYELRYNRGQLPAGFINSSAEDMAHYLIAHLNGGSYGSASILSPAGVAELHRPAAVVPTEDKQAAYAMGWFVGETDGVRIVSHAGSTASFHSDLALIPQAKWGIVLLMNGEDGLRSARISAIVDGVTSLVLGKRPTPPASTDSGPTFLLYALIILAVQILACINSLRLLRRWHRRPASRPRGWLRPALRIVPPLVLSAMWSVVCLKVLPLFLGSPLVLPIFVPDLGYTLLLSLALAIGWGVIKPILVVLVLRAHHAPPAVAAEVPLPVTA